MEAEFQAITSLKAPPPGWEPKVFGRREWGAPHPAFLTADRSSRAATRQKDRTPVDDFPFRLKFEDSAAAPDPQALLIDHMADLRAISEDAHHLIKLLSRWGEDPAGVFRRALARSVELAEQADRATRGGEDVARALRAGGVISPDRRPRS
jgi:hypothetical protein